jgi:hypothetical protein
VAAVAAGTCGVGAGVGLAVGGGLDGTGAIDGVDAAALDGVAGAGEAGVVDGTAAEIDEDGERTAGLVDEEPHADARVTRQAATTSALTHGA